MTGLLARRAEQTQEQTLNPHLHLKLHARQYSSGLNSVSARKIIVSVSVLRSHCCNDEFLKSLNAADNLPAKYGYEQLSIDDKTVTCKHRKCFFLPRHIIKSGRQHAKDCDVILNVNM